MDPPQLDPDGDGGGRVVGSHSRRVDDTRVKPSDTLHAGAVRTRSAGRAHSADVDSTREIAYEAGLSRFRVPGPGDDAPHQRPVARLHSIKRVELHMRLAEARG